MLFYLIANPPCRKAQKIQREKEELEDELYELKRKYDEQVDTIKDLEEASKSSSAKIKSMIKKLQEKDKLIEENKKSLCYYTDKYMKDAEERGKAQEAKVESGCEASKGQLVDITDLDMKIIEKQHKLERLEFYEKNNMILLEQMSTKDAELESKYNAHAFEVDNLVKEHQKQIEKLQKEFEKQLHKEKVKSTSILEAALREEKQVNEKERKELREEFHKMFNVRLAEWKSQADQYEVKIRKLENMINSMSES